ncbi:MAG: tetratricopeptide repeat protein [Calditrichia bacterium]
MKNSLLIVSVVALLSTSQLLLLSCNTPKELPPLPNFQNSSGAVNSHVDATYAEVLKNSGDQAVVGKMAMVLHSNFFYKEAQLWYNAAQKRDSTKWLWSYYPALIVEELGDANSTISHLKKVVKVNPQVANAWFKLGNLYIKQNDYQTAETAFSMARNSKTFTYADELPNKGAFPLLAYAQFSLGRVYLLQKKHDDAKEELLSLIQRYPRFGAAYRLLGQLYTSQGDMLSGKNMIERAGDFESYIPPADPMFNALLLNSRDSDFILKQIDIAINSENFPWAEMLCKHILQYDPNDIDAIAKSILLMLVKNDSHGLAEKVKKFFEYYKTNDAKLYEMAESLYRWRQNKFASNYLQQALAVNPQAIDAHVLYLKILTALKSDELAAKHCKKALAIAPDNSQLRTEYGRIMLLQGDEKEAKRQLGIAIKNSPDNEVPFIVRGILAQNNGDVDVALRNYRRSVKIKPSNVNATKRLGNYLLELRRWADAFSVYEAALNASPNKIDLLERTAWILATCPSKRIRNGERALELAKRLTLIRKEGVHQDIECAITLAAAYAEKGEFDRAIGVLNNLIPRAKATRMQRYIPQVREMIKLFEANSAYRM